MKIKRGQIVLYSIKLKENSSIQRAKNRPGIVVSNNSCNNFSPVITIVPLNEIKRKKRRMPTHILVNFENQENYAMCEQILSVDKDEVIPLEFFCTDQEMNDIEFGLMLQLGIIKRLPQTDSQNDAETCEFSIYENGVSKEKTYHEYEDNKEKENNHQNHTKNVIRCNDEIYNLGDVIIMNICCRKCENERWKISQIDKYITLTCCNCNKERLLSMNVFRNGVLYKINNYAKEANLFTKEDKMNMDVYPSIIESDENKNDQYNETNKDNELQINKFGKILKNDDIVMLNENMKCKWCKNQVYRISDLSESISDKVKISCLNCKTEKNIGRIDFFNSIIETDKARIFNSINSSFIAYGDGESRLKKTKNIYRDALDVVNSGAIFELQLIDSPKNHVTVGHDIENRSISIAYKEKGLIRTFKYKCHYCQTCKKYFDFGYSFDSQLKANGIAFDTLLLNLSKTELYSFLGNGFESFNSETFLHSQGYKVGYSGASSGTRKLILDRLIEQSLMTISEIKSVINNNIHRFSDRPGYEYAVSEWEDDIEYLNKKIK